MKYVLRTPSNLNWVTPPKQQGQIVSYAYSSSRDGIYWRRRKDSSQPIGQQDTYSWASAEDCGCKNECSCFEPWNETPAGFDWHPALPPL